MSEVSVNLTPTIEIWREAYELLKQHGSAVVILTQDHRLMSRIFVIKEKDKGSQNTQSEAIGVQVTSKRLSPTTNGHWIYKIQVD